MHGPPKKYKIINIHCAIKYNIKAIKNRNILVSRYSLSVPISLMTISKLIEHPFISSSKRGMVGIETWKNFILLHVTLIYYNETQLRKVFTERYYIIMFNSNQSIKTFKNDFDQNLKTIKRLFMKKLKSFIVKPIILVKVRGTEGDGVPLLIYDFEWSKEDIDPMHFVALILLGVARETLVIMCHVISILSCRQSTRGGLRTSRDVYWIKYNYVPSRGFHIVLENRSNAINLLRNELFNFKKKIITIGSVVSENIVPKGIAVQHNYTQVASLRFTMRREEYNFVTRYYYIINKCLNIGQQDYELRMRVKASRLLLKIR
ncbi:hypothetical protein AGLY_004051 [Aphis glycines]|uniref:Uncharacterized protein n=1 Tax=Aphis glycines TaxID=307491 RepID=A0A6G0TX21_APHGL|nr:hypothetical protein AGLY_004051 [Aphis glycines]